MLENFKKHLTHIEYPSKEEEKKELWNISGILINRLNQKLKFDTRPITKEGFKIGSFKTKADKIVFLTDKWIIVDVEELHNYINKNNKKNIYLHDLIKELDWNIELEKVKI